MIPVYSPVYVDDAVDVRAAMSRVIARGRYVLGPEVERFEQAFADYCGVGECVTVANGTDALELALKAVGVGPGSSVALVANAGYYGTAALRAVGATPRYIDVDGETLTMSVDALAAALGERLDAVLVTHLYGRLAAIEDLLDLARDAGLPVVEDCAQAHGAMRGGKRAGSFGTAACFSFYPTKNLPAIGDAGAVVTSDPAIARRIRSLRQYGWTAKYHVEAGGGRNSRMDEIQAAVLNDRLPRLEEWNAQRRSIAERYVAAFVGHPAALPSLGEDYVAHLFVLRTSRRDDLRQSLFADDVATDVHYPVPDYRQPANPQVGTSLPVTERVCREVCTLPCYPGMTSAQTERVTRAVARHFEAVQGIPVRAAN
jgi:dTDP-4-amino-4,6-dideoxygalactose transaminase